MSCPSCVLFVAQTVPRLLHALCSDELTVWEHLETQQALFKQFAEILDFIMQFDNLKVSKLFHDIVSPLSFKSIWRKCF